ncbi:MAG: nuclear transport factor 2 family protein [Gemmatimonadetes bacterium]|nr:nuclear transport factor 2 family protein [Gemmatimonadota bacterium]
MIRHASFVVALLAGLAGPCAPPSRTADASVADVARDSTAIEALHRADERAVVAGDTTTLMHLWTDDVVALLPSGAVMQGRTANAAVLRRDVEGLRVLTYELKASEIKVLGAHAYEWGRWAGTFRAGNAPVARASGSFFRVLRRSDAGTWLIARTMFAYDSAAPQSVDRGPAR